MNGIGSCTKKTIAALIAVVVMLTPVTAHAAYTYEDAAEEFYDTLELIDSVYYFKDGLDYKKLLDEALLSVFGQLDDYSEYLTLSEYNEFSEYQDASKSGIGVNITKTGAGYLEVLKVFKGSPAEEAGILKGDFIMRIGGVDIVDKSLMEAKELIVGANGTDVTLSVIRNGEIVEISATRGTFYAPSADRTSISELIEGADASKTAYVQISAFSHSEDNAANDTAKQFKKIYQDLKREKIENLIIDLRGNPGGDVAAVVEICELLVKAGVMFTFKYNGQEDDVFTARNTTAPEFNVAVLVDDLSASSSEIMASAIKESGSGIVVGCNTFGKGVGQIPIPAVDGKHVIKLTVTEIISRNGNKINGVGVMPDIFVEPAPWVNVDKAIGAGSTSEEISSLKNALNYLGYEAGTGGIYDSKLTESIKAFQKSISLEPDGICSADLIWRINSYVSDKSRKTDTTLSKAYEALNAN